MSTEPDNLRYVAANFHVSAGAYPQDEQLAMIHTAYFDHGVCVEGELEINLTKIDQTRRKFARNHMANPPYPMHIALTASGSKLVGVRIDGVFYSLTEKELTIVHVVS